MNCRLYLYDHVQPLVLTHANGLDLAIDTLRLIVVKISSRHKYVIFLAGCEPMKNLKSFRW